MMRKLFISLLLTWTIFYQKAVAGGIWIDTHSCAVPIPSQQYIIGLAEITEAKDEAIEMARHAVQMMQFARAYPDSDTAKRVRLTLNTLLATPGPESPAWDLIEGLSISLSEMMREEESSHQLVSSEAPKGQLVLSMHISSRSLVANSVVRALCMARGRMRAFHFTLLTHSRSAANYQRAVDLDTGSETRMLFCGDSDILIGIVPFHHDPQLHHCNDAIPGHNIPHYIAAYTDQQFTVLCPDIYFTREDRDRRFLRGLQMTGIGRNYNGVAFESREAVSTTLLHELLHMGSWTQPVGGQITGTQASGCPRTRPSASFLSHFRFDFEEQTG